MSASIRKEIVLRNKLHLVCDEVGPVPDGAYGYTASLWAAGVSVLDFQRFGSYQGDWWAHVQFPNGDRYFVNGYYGSCSSCDAFERDFGWGDDKEPDYLHKLRDFGRDYLEDCYTLEQAIELASRNIAWDSDAEEMVAWLKVKGDTSTLGLAAVKAIRADEANWREIASLWQPVGGNA